MPIINPTDFIRGESSSDYIADGGFSPDSYGLNLTKEPGILYFIESSTDRGGATLTGNIIASCPDPQTTGNDAYFIDDEGAFYRLNGATLTKGFTGANTYQLGTSDLKPFNDANFYATSTTAVAQFDNNLGTVTENWWTGLTSGFRHPLEVVEKELFIADKNVIYYWDGTTSGTAFTLPVQQNVTSLRKHPDGKTLLAFTGGTADFSHTRNGAGKVYYCQPTLRGSSIEGWSREVELESQVEGTIVVGGVVFATWGKNLGYFDGNGLVWLKRLETSGTTYSQSMANNEDILLFRDGINVKAYGNLGAGNVFWNCFRNTTNTNHITNIHYKGDNKVLYSFQGASAGTGLLQEVDYDNAGTVGNFYSNRYFTPEERVYRFIDILHTVTNSGGASEFGVKYRDLDDNESNIISDGVISYLNQTVSRTQKAMNVRSNAFQLVLQGSTDDIGYKQIRITDDAPAK